MGKKEVVESKVENMGDANLPPEPKTKKTSPKETKKIKGENYQGPSRQKEGKTNDIFITMSFQIVWMSTAFTFIIFYL